MPTSKEEALVEDAVRRHEVELLLRGKWPYQVEEAYMERSDVPQNWSRLLVDGLMPAAKSCPSLIPDLEAALSAMLFDAEGIYCASGFLFACAFRKADVSLALGLDLHGLFSRLQVATRRSAADLTNARPKWLVPPETLLERVEHVLHQTSVELAS